MTPQIKQRIEQIQRGEVPEGYKKTKVGVVPSEWEETLFSDLFTSTSEYDCALINGSDIATYSMFSALSSPVALCTAKGSAISNT